MTKKQKIYMKTITEKTKSVSIYLLRMQKKTYFLAFQKQKTDNLDKKIRNR